MSPRNPATRRVLLAVAALATLAAGYALGHWSTGRRTAAVAAGAPATPAGEILYYRNPMGLPDVSPVPRKDAMGMDYVPVRAGDAAADGLLRISTARQQLAGVKLAPVERATLGGTLRLAGTVQADEHGLATVAARVDGYVTALRVAATATHVRRGEPLLEAWSPEFQAAQQEFQLAERNRAALAGAAPEAQAAAARVAEAALERLRNWGMGDTELAALRAGGAPQAAFVLRAPRDGVVVDKPARVGLRFQPGDVLYQLADLSSVWLLADVHEQDLGAVRVGVHAQAMFVAFPGRSYPGRVESVAPMLAEASRSAQLRIVLANPGGELRPGMYASVQLDLPAGEPALSVPATAVIDTGERRVAFVRVGEGLFARRELRTGRSVGGRVEVLDGLAEGEQVVAEGNFLVDAESNLDAAASALER